MRFCALLPGELLFKTGELLEDKNEEVRTKAAEYKKRGTQTDAPDEIRELKTLEKTFSELAENEEWMEQNSEKILHRPAKDQDE